MSSAASPPSDNDARRRASSSPNRPAYTLTACIRCRERKSKCDANLPRCGSCEKSGQHNCEYWDATKRMRLPRSHIVRLRTEVEKLELALAQYDIHDNLEPDDEDLVRDAAVVEFKDTAERKFLGAASGTTMTRLVMRLAKQVLGVRSINDVISAERIRQIDAKTAKDHSKPIAKVSDYPLVSSYAETTLPHSQLCNILLNLYNVKVQSMYPLFHEPSLSMLFDEVIRETQSHAKNFIVRMVIAISLQRLETKWAGVADSYYLGALTFFEEVVRAMNLETLQCCILIGQYSLLTPTRTAAWYIIGLGVRLAQQLGYAEEDKIVLNERGQRATPLEIDLRRRAFWAIATMDYGLAHSLGRPAAMATDQLHINVRFFEQIDDVYIGHDGIQPGPLSVRKWIAMHFYNMRMLQLEMRRMLYLKKRDTPKSDTDPWFKYMEKKLDDWLHATPRDDEGSGFSEEWFKGRYHTMIVLLFRPSPQVPRPSARAAMLCYDACEWNITMHQDQRHNRTIEMTWAWTQSLFMAVNTILWSLAYVEVRERRTREQVKERLDIALESMTYAAERWPGVASAIELYEALINACLQVFDKEGDVPIQSSPFTESDRGKSLSPSPNLGHPTLPLTPLLPTQPTSRQRFMFQPILPSSSTVYNTIPTSGSMNPLPSPGSSTTSRSSFGTTMSNNNNATANAFHAQFSNPPQVSQAQAFATAPPLTNSSPQFTSLPATYSQLNEWQFSPTAAVPAPNDVQNGQWSGDPEDDTMWGDMSAFGDGLDQTQQQQMLRDLETRHMGRIENIVEQGDAFWRQHASLAMYQPAWSGPG